MYLPLKGSAEFCRHIQSSVKVTSTTYINQIHVHVYIIMAKQPSFSAIFSHTIVFQTKFRRMKQSLLYVISYLQAISTFDEKS